MNENKNKTNTTKASRSRRLKYGSLSLVFTLVVVAFAIAFNLVITALDKSVDLQVDLTETQLYSVSDETDQALQIGLGDAYDTFDVTIYFLMQRDLFDYTYYSNASTGEVDSQYYIRVRDLAEEYARLYPGNIKVEYIDMTRDPEFVNKYYTESQTALTTSNIIIQGKYHYRVLSFSAMYYTSEETSKLYAFRGERMYTAAILQSSLSEAPVISMTTGHGESWSDALTEIFAATEFEVQQVNLREQDIDPRTKILVICNPLSDFIGYDGSESTSTEIDKLTTFMSDTENYNSLMVFVNADTQPLPNLQEYLWEYWGINYKANYKISDESKSIAGRDFYSVIGEYQAGTANSAAYLLHQTASQKGIPSVFRNAVALERDATGNRSCSIEASVSSYATSYATHKDADGNLVEEAGAYPLILLSTLHGYGDNNANKYKYVMLVGSTDFASSGYLTDAYGNRNILYTATRNMSTDRVVPDIGYKTFTQTALTLSEETANTLTLLVTIAVPLVILIVGFVVFFRRRHL